MGGWVRPSLTGVMFRIIKKQSHVWRRTPVRVPVCVGACPIHRCGCLCASGYVCTCVRIGCMYVRMDDSTYVSGCDCCRRHCHGRAFSHCFHPIVIAMSVQRSGTPCNQEYPPPPRSNGPPSARCWESGGGGGGGGGGACAHPPTAVGWKTGGIRRHRHRPSISEMLGIGRWWRRWRRWRRLCIGRLHSRGVRRRRNLRGKGRL